MRQRVMIAMALACAPKLLIADEPTTALDVTVQAQILELMKHLQERLGMSVLLITHDLGVVAETAHRVVVMYAGRVVERATSRDLFARPRQPYAAGLFRSLPRIDANDARLEPIKGTVPNTLRSPPGCRVRPRCPYAPDVCKAAVPPRNARPGRVEDRASACRYVDAHPD